MIPKAGRTAKAGGFRVEADSGVARLGLQGRVRLWVAVVLSLGLLVAVLATPAGAANGDPVHSRDAGTAAGGLKPAKYLNGILDAVSGAVSLTGPQGFVLGVSLFLYKELIGAAEGPEDAASAQLRANQ